ncbi:MULTISPECIES: TIGR03621 family F420-dependent LLM class oxidoreductase [Amycolatopsis]|uniref:LLM class flavin-dependent oxidoreductase n=2 Tax=Amycolatopsis TaxID=1813 RepID=A0ABP8VLE3_9PSEU|nr:TIGR03621 family F420-dependent LLM class oxidoreductase [Amycolatopsis sacchari]SFK27418.1 probable F420-dependent oxidoreductase, MSMEG_2516 family [Amycolatopsis sacchari]
MSPRVFRFGLVVGPRQPAPDWAALARRAEDLGFSTLLVPDGTGALSPFPVLGGAATVTERLRLGTFVLAVPLRPPGLIAWEAASLDRFSGGRFELGLGAGRPDAARDAEVVGVPFGTAGERVRQVAETVDTVDRLYAEGTFEGRRPPVMIAGGGDRLLSVAAQRADIVAVHADGSERGLGEKLRLVRDVAGNRFDALELSVNVFHIGDGEMSPLVRLFGIDPATAQDNRHVSVLNGDTATVIDTLKRRRDEFGVSYVTINAATLETAAPVVEALSGT